VDAWFVGYQPTVVAATWVGYDAPRNLGSRETGGGLSLPIWISYMAEVLKDVPVELAPPPAGLVNVGGDWYFEEYGPGQGVRSLGLSDPWPGAVSSETDAADGTSDAAPVLAPEDRRSILDLFRN
jgi:penicillin-binding protein 1A